MGEGELVCRGMGGGGAKVVWGECYDECEGVWGSMGAFGECEGLCSGCEGVWGKSVWGGVRVSLQSVRVFDVGGGVWGEGVGGGGGGLG